MKFIKLTLQSGGELYVSPERITSFGRRDNKEYSFIVIDEPQESDSESCYRVKESTNDILTLLYKCSHS